MKFNFINKEIRKIPSEKIPNINSVYNNTDLDDNDLDVEREGDFYDFSNGSPITNGELQRWIVDIVNYFNEDGESSFCNISCGNSMVIGLRRDDGTVQIIVTNSYMEATIDVD